MLEYKTRKLYLNASQEKAMIVHPKNYFGIIGRASGKSQRILAIRTSRIAFDMPGADFGFYGNSYMNLQQNLIPNILKGWRELGYRQGVDFVIDTKPNDYFLDGNTVPLEWKHVITWSNGSKFYLISDDRPDNANGRSIQHFFGDEIKLVSYDKMSRSAFPAIRGERLKYGNVPQFQGFTFTTDMPDPILGQWLFDMMESMDEEQIDCIIQSELYRSDCLRQLYDVEYENYTQDPIKRNYLWEEVQTFDKILAKLRMNSTYAEISSTLVNIDALGEDYLDNQILSLGWAGFKSAILSILMPTADVLFYSRFGSHNLLKPNFDYSFSDKSGLGEKIKIDSRSSKWTDPHRSIIGGLDIGNMNSLVLNQEFGREFRTIKCMHVLQPEIIDDLAKQFVDFYKYHQKKHLELYYDRSANNRMPNSRVPTIMQFKNRILEYDSDWYVELKSLHMKNVPHEDRKLLIDAIHSENDSTMPIHRIDESNAMEYVSSVRFAPYLTQEKKKDKSSEKKRRLESLPSGSTNYSDANDYAIWGKYGSRIKGDSFAGMTPKTS